MYTSTKLPFYFISEKFSHAHRRRRDKGQNQHLERALEKKKKKKNTKEIVEKSSLNSFSLSIHKESLLLSFDISFDRACIIPSTNGLVYIYLYNLARTIVDAASGFAKLVKLRFGRKVNGLLIAGEGRRGKSNDRTGGKRWRMENNGLGERVDDTRRGPAGPLLSG